MLLLNRFDTVHYSYTGWQFSKKFWWSFHFPQWLSSHHSFLFPSSLVDCSTTCATCCSLEFNKFLHCQLLLMTPRDSSVCSLSISRATLLVMETILLITCTQTFQSHLYWCILARFLQTNLRVWYMTSSQALWKRLMHWRALECFL